MSQVTSNDVQLGDVRRIALPLKIEVIANDGYDKRSVNWVSILHATEQLVSQVQPGDIAILPSNLHNEITGKELKNLIEALANLSASALLVYVGIPEEIQTVANNVDLPIFVIENDVSMRDVHKNIAALLLDRQNQIAERGMQLYRELSETSREGGGLQKMAQLIGSLTGKIVVIQDKRLEIQAIERPIGSIEFSDQDLNAAISEQDNMPAVLRNRKAAAKATREHWQQLLFPHETVARLISPIISGDRARGYLSIIGEAGELDLLDAVAVEQGSAACALEMAKVKAVSEAKKELRGNFLEGILAGSIPKSEVERLSSRLDHDTERPHAIMTLRWNKPLEGSLRRIETTLNWLITNNDQGTLIHIYGDDHLTVFHALRNSEESSSAHRLARRLRSQLASEYPDLQLVAGISGPVTTLTDWPEFHQQAVQAMEVAQRLNVDELVEYNNLGVYQLLSQLDNVPAVTGFCNQVIGPLVDYDREHRSNLVQTIEEYFNHHGNVSQTAEALYIHRNTLLYRLERLQELTGHDLNQADMRLALHLALKLWQLRPME